MEVQGLNIISKKPIIPAFKGGIQTAPVREDNTTAKIYGDKKGINIKGQYLINTSPNGYKELKTAKIPFSHDAKIYQMNNGQKVVIVPKKGPTVLKTFVDVGSMNERDQIRGISHFIEHSLFNGSKNLKPGEFVDDIYELGSGYNASTGFALTDYYVNSPIHSPKDLDELIKIHADMIKNPLFLDKQIEKEKGPVISEIQMYEDDPYNASYNRVLKQLFNVHTDSSDMIGGSVKNIQALNKQKVKNYYKAHYTPENMVTVVVGNISPERTMKLLSKNFADFVRTTPKNEIYNEKLTPLETTKRIDLKSPNANSAIVNMAFAGPSADNLKETMIFNMINASLVGYGNAALTKAMEKFDTSASIETEVVSSKNSNPQAIIVSAEFKPSEEEKGMQEMYSTLHKFKNSKVSPKELMIVKNKLINSLKYASESSMSITNYIGNSIINRGSLNYYTDALTIIKSITADDIKKVASKYFDLNKASIVVMHPQNYQQPAVASKQLRNVAFSGSMKRSTLPNRARPNVGEIKEYDLNNYRVAVHNNEDSEFVSTNIAYNKEATLDFKPGTDWILESLLEKGTAYHSKDEFNELTDIHNIYISPSVGNDGISFNVFGEPKDLKMAMGLTKELINSPNFSAEEFEKAKSEIKLAVNSMQKQPIGRLQEKLYPKGPNGHSIRIIKENIDKVSLDDVKTLYAQMIENSECMVNSTFSKEKYPKTQEVLFETLNSGMPSVKPYSFDMIKEHQDIDKNYVITDTQEQNQAVILQAFKFKESGSVKDEAAFSILNEILGGNSHSMLFDDLREKQKLAYDVHSDYINIGDSGIIKLKIKTTTTDKKNGVNSFENIQKSLDGFKHYTDKLQNEPVSEKRLEQAKLSLKKRLINATQRTDDQNTVIAGGYKTFYGAKHIQALNKAIENMNAQDIQNYARYAFSKNSVISMVASKDSIEANKDYLASKGDLEQYGLGKTVNSNAQQDTQNLMRA